jgi:hypothetical protein
MRRKQKMNKGCETCYFSKTFVAGNETHFDCTLDTIKEINCVLEGFSNYVSIEDVIIPLRPKENDDD